MVNGEEGWDIGEVVEVESSGSVKVSLMKLKKIYINNVWNKNGGGQTNVGKNCGVQKWNGLHVGKRGPH